MSRSTRRLVILGVRVTTAANSRKIEGKRNRERAYLYFAIKMGSRFGYGTEFEFV